MLSRELIRLGLWDHRAVPTIPAKGPHSGPGWIHEIKHDGFRILARREAPSAVLMVLLVSAEL
jgi:hypothetical protein